MARKEKVEYTCTVTYTEGWEKRVTEAFVDLYFKLKEEGRLPKPKLNKTEETA